MDATAVAISVLSASVAFVGLVFSALAFARSSPAKIYKREQDKAMRKLATQTLLMDRNMELIAEAARAARDEAKRLKALFDNGELRDPHVAGLDLRDYDGSAVGPAPERHLLRMRYNIGEDGMPYVLRHSQELAKRLDSAIEEALSNDLWGVIVQLPSDLRKRAMGDSSLTVPADEFMHARYTSFRQALQSIASLDEEALGTSAFVQPHFIGGVVRMVTVCRAYHRTMSSTSSAPLVAALDASIGYLELGSRDQMIHMAWGLDGRGSPRASGAGEAASRAARDGGAGQAQQQPAHDGGVHGRATTSTAARVASLVRDLSRNRATGISNRATSISQGNRAGSTHLEMADLEQLLGAMRDRAGPPQASACTASTSRAAQQATPEIRSAPAVPSRAHREGPASVSVSTKTAPGTDASQPPCPQGHLLIPGAESAAATVHVQVAPDKATSAREVEASGSESSSQPQQ